MSSPTRVKRGIYIDMGCSHICQIDEGIFIPTGYQTNESEKEFQEDLSAFLEKWFTLCTSGSDDSCGRIEFESEEVRKQISKTAAQFSLSVTSGGVEDLLKFAPEWSEISRKLLSFWVSQGSPRLPS